MSPDALLPFPEDPAVPRRPPSRAPLLWLLLDVLVVALAAVPLLGGHNEANATLAAAFTATALAAAALVSPQARDGRRLPALAGGVAIAALLTGLLADLTRAELSVGQLAAAWVLGTVGLVALRRARLALRALGVRRGATGRTVIVGTGRTGRLIAERLRAEPRLGMSPVGFVDDDPAPDTGGLPVLGRLATLERAVREAEASHVVVAFPKAAPEDLLALVGRCQQQGARVLVVPRLYEAVPRRVALDHLGGLSLLSLFPSAADTPGLRVKYLMERLTALGLLVLLAPLALVVALAVRLTLGSPVLFRQQRVGLEGRTFEIMKFRSMRAATGPDDDDAARVSRLGRLLRMTSLDELPQLVNILRGDMSFVGPRPERPDLVAQFEAAVPGYARRHRVRPGITGWAQVHGIGRGHTRFAPKDLAERAEWDNHYIENWSLPLEARIYARTVAALFRHRQTTGGAGPAPGDR